MVAGWSWIGGGDGGGGDWLGPHLDILWGDKMFCISIGLWVIQVCEFVNAHSTESLRFVHFIECEFKKIF